MIGPFVTGERRLGRLRNSPKQVTRTAAETEIDAYADLLIPRVCSQQRECFGIIHELGCPHHRQAEAHSSGV